MNNYIQTTVISLVVAFFFGIIFIATAITPVVAEAAEGATKSAAPIKINAKKALKLYVALDCLQEEQDLISQVFAKTFKDNNFSFAINHKLVSYDHQIKTNLDDIRSMIKEGNYDEASNAIKEYRHLLREQVRDAYLLMPLEHMVKCLINADKLGVEWYFKN